MIFKQAKQLHGEITIPGDKSISHRSIMFGAISEGTTVITHFLNSADCLSTIDCFRNLGIEIETNPDEIKVHGKGLYGLSKPDKQLYTGNSGTTTRLISGILCAQAFETTLTGDASICKRPMGRIITPLSLMGAHIESANNNNCTPLIIKPSKLKGITYESPVASAQVKSSILLAGLYADSPTTVTEPSISRNHSEIMLKSFGADINVQGKSVTIMPNPKLFSQKISVPGDISSAAYFIAAGLLVPNSEILIKNVGINPTRCGIIKAALAMGGNIECINRQLHAGEETCDLLVRSSNLHGITISGDIIPTLIDEIPVIAVMAAFAEGTTIIKDAAELKVKESDRIKVVTDNLLSLGCDVTPTDDGMIIHGGKPLHGGKLYSADDHRIAMSFSIAGLLTDSVVEMENAECVNISYPNFYSDLEGLID